MSETKIKNAHVWERGELDWYVEPEAATASLLKEERFVGAIHDPACGQGNIVKTLIAHGYHASGSDVVDRAGTPGWFKGKADFLGPEAIFADNIVTNPPFFRGKGTESFIRKALRVAKGKVAVFTELRFLTSSVRANGLYAEHPPTRIWMVTPRPSCPPGEFLLAGGEAKGGTPDFCWIIYDKTAPLLGTAFGWLRGDAKGEAP
ncbi:hypothetical protein [Rhizobium sp. SSA_523]|uniref:hypothetical protein n=1 Tax=Rhizobium sp. SSA_523 TaxID=2952477 RepID=UPI002091AFEE|nr:hypothetical protein [Rhizobium sp. SSA_523]MCO5730131.1 hypothetical protein [Rhizobium sp. SSA_523]WKC25195.1 hypothetical protein QTJ18_14510 [Rhizobium sp. SSA_523]